MDILNGLATGFAVAVTPANPLFVLLGVLLGTVIGLLPGLRSTAAIAVLLAATFGGDVTQFMYRPVSAVMILVLLIVLGVSVASSMRRRRGARTLASNILA